MRTSNNGTGQVAIFFLAHQDDEFGAFQALVEETVKGRRIVCIYFTDGGANGAATKIRNEESSKVLRKFGVFDEDIIFAGEILSIYDGKLADSLYTANVWIRTFLSKTSGIEAIYVPAWEGGHPDHDALHAATVLASSQLNCLSKIRQFALYNAYKCVGKLFRVLSPLPCNGPTECTAISWPNRLRFLSYCLSYPSQYKSWIGLFPFVLFQYLVNGRIALQLVAYERITERPHPGPLYYERRGFFSWDAMKYRVDLLIQKTVETTEKT